MDKTDWKAIAIFSVVFNLLFLIGVFAFEDRLTPEEKEIVRIRTENISLAFYLKGLAEAHLAKEDFEKALEAFERSHLHNPNDAGTLLTMGYTHKRLGDLELAKHYYLASLQVAGSGGVRYKAYNNLANTYNQQGKFTSAGAVYREAIKMRPNGWLAQYNYAVMLQESGRKAKGDSILLELEKVRLCRPEVLKRLAQSFLDAGMPDSAQIRLDRLSQLYGE